MRDADPRVQHLEFRSPEMWVHSTSQMLQAVRHQHLSDVGIWEEYSVSNGYKHCSLSLLCASLKKPNWASPLSFIPHDVSSTMDPHNHRRSSLSKSSLGNRHIQEEAIFTFGGPYRCIRQSCIRPERCALRAYLAIGSILDTR